MKYVDAAARTVYRGGGGTEAPVIYVVDMPEYPFEIAEVAQGRACTVVKVPVSHWDDSLTPWPAPGLYRGDADFKGEAAITLEELADEAIPAIERTEGLAPAARAICGYSLGGLFALYAFTHAQMFRACACLSGSVWYEGWVEHLRSLPLNVEGRFAYFSIGSKEKHAAPPILHSVQDNMAECADILRGRGCAVDFRVGPGNHMSHGLERFDAGLSALDSFLRRTKVRHSKGTVPFE